MATPTRALSPPAKAAKHGGPAIAATGLGWNHCRSQYNAYTPRNCETESFAKRHLDLLPHIFCTFNCRERRCEQDGAPAVSHLAGRPGYWRCICRQRLLHRL